MVGVNVPAEHCQHESSQRQHCDQAAQLDDPRDDQRMLVGAGIVVVAVGQDIVYRRPDAIGGGLYQSKAQILGRVLDAHVVLRELSLRSHDLDGTGMRKLGELSIGPGNLYVTEANRLGQRIDIALRTGEKVPAVGAFRMPVALDVRALALFRARPLRCDAGRLSAVSRRGACPGCRAD